MLQIQSPGPESFGVLLLILIQFQQVPRGGWLPTTRHGSAQNSVSLLPNTTPSQFTVVAAGQGEMDFHKLLVAWTLYIGNEICDSVAEMATVMLTCTSFLTNTGVICANKV